MNRHGDAREGCFELPELASRDAKWFFDQSGYLGGDGLKTEGGMKMIGYGDRHRVDVRRHFRKIPEHGNTRIEVSSSRDHRGQLGAVGRKMGGVLARDLSPTDDADSHMCHDVAHSQYPIRRDAATSPRRREVCMIEEAGAPRALTERAARARFARWDWSVPMKRLLLALPFVVLVGACSSGGSGSEPVETETAPKHLGGCILLSPAGEAPEDPYQVGDVEPTDAYPPFTKKLTVYGLTLVAADNASDEFMRKVATTIREIFPRDESLDLDQQEDILRNHYLYNALIPVPVGRDTDFFDDDETRTRLTSNNSVCDIIMEGVDGQVMEVVEHILHYVSDLGLHYTFPDEWGISKTSALAQAMNKAVDEGYYDVTSYEDIDDEEVRHRVMMQEFAYWVISTAWNLQEPYGPIGEDEWTIKNEQELMESLPEFFEVYERTVGRTMVAPSLATLSDIGPHLGHGRRNGRRMIGRIFVFRQNAALLHEYW